MEAKRVLHIPDVLYHRRIRPNSIITRPISHKNVLGLFSCAESMLAYALHGTHSREEEREILRAYTAMINTAKRYYLAVPPEEKAKVVFPSDTVAELFKQTVLCSIQIDELKDKLQRISPLKSFQVNDVAVAQDGNTLMLTNYFSAVPVRYAWYVYKGREAIIKQMYTRENSNSFSYEFTEPGNYSISAFVQMMDKSDTKSVCAATVSVKESGLIWKRP